MTTAQVLEQLASTADPDAHREMTRVGINVAKSYGIKTPVLRGIARQIGKDHLLALERWESGISDARHLAYMVDVPARIEESQMEDWASDFDSWDVTDSACFGWFARRPSLMIKLLIGANETRSLSKEAASC